MSVCKTVMLPYCHIDTGSGTVHLLISKELIGNIDIISGKNKAFPFPNKPWFLRVYSISLLKTLGEKEKFLVMSNFSFSHSVFYQFWTTFFNFYQIQNFRLQTLSVWESLKLVVWERVKPNQFHERYCILLKDRNDNLIIKSYRSMLQVLT